MRRTRQLTHAVALAAALALAGAGCAEDAAAPDASTTACAPPVYGGEGTDEVWRAMLDGERLVAVGSPEAVTVTAPADGAALVASDGPPTFAWTSPLAWAPATRDDRAREPDLWAAVLGLGPALAALWEGEAHAHLPPVTGDVYYVAIAVPGQACDVLAVTTELAWTPDGVSWARLGAAAGATLELTVTSAYLRENVIAEGPYRPARATRFSVR